MNRPSLKFGWMLAPLMVVVVGAFNSCRGGFLTSGGGFASARSSSCKVGMYKGQLVNLADLADADPFQSKKVHLSPSGGSQTQSKPVDSSLGAGEKLAVILDNTCLQRSGRDLAQTAFSSIADSGGVMLPDLDRQAYTWSADRPYTEAELETNAQSDPCVIGAGRSQNYKLQSFNDSNTFYQSYLPFIRAEQSYPYFYNSAGGMDKSAGDPVLIAVIDTGVDWQHPDLSANLWRHQYGIGIDITTVGGTVDYNPYDVSSIGHGSHVSGMIAAVTDNGQGISGTMPFRAQIMAIKLFRRDNTTGELTTTSQDFYNAVRFAYQNGAKVINLSVGNITFGPNTDALAEASINDAVAKGVTVVTVTGNADSGQNGAEINSSSLTVIPGMYSTKAGVIAVGSLDLLSGNKSYFSHYSTTYGEIAAPGAEQGITGIYSTIPTALGSYGRLAGTSQAAPLVSAAAGLVVGLIREATHVAPAPAEVERLILASAVKDPRLTSYFKDGNRLDLLNLVQKVNADYPSTRDSALGSSSIDLSSVGCPQ